MLKPLKFFVLNEKIGLLKDKKILRTAIKNGIKIPSYLKANFLMHTLKTLQGALQDGRSTQTLPQAPVELYLFIYF